MGKKRKQVGLICGKRDTFSSAVSTARAARVFSRPEIVELFRNQTSEWGSPLLNKMLLTIVYFCDTMGQSPVSFIKPKCFSNFFSRRDDIKADMQDCRLFKLHEGKLILSHTNVDLLQN